MLYLIKSIGDAAGDAVTMLLSTSADSENANFYIVHEGDTETFTASVSVNPTATGFYQFGVDAIRFSSVSSSLNSLQTLDVDENKSQFKTDPLNIHS